MLNSLFEQKIFHLILDIKQGKSNSIFFDAQWFMSFWNMGCQQVFNW